MAVDAARAQHAERVRFILVWALSDESEIQPDYEQLEIPSDASDGGRH